MKIKRNQSRRGFTLAEVLTTMFFLGVALPACMRAIAVALGAAAFSKNMTQATVLAEAKLNEIISQGITEETSEGGDFPYYSGFPTYRWEYRVYQANSDMEYLYQIDLLVEWDDRGISREVELNSYFYNMGLLQQATSVGGTGVSSGTTTGGTSK
jgi:hypothetical protein